MTAKRRSRRMVALIAVIMAVLLAEAVLVAAVFVSPTASTRLRGVAADVGRAWAGSKGSPGIPARIAGVINRGYRSWIAPLWSGPTPPKANGEFADCVSCHRDYAAKRRYSSVYMNHPLHAELGVACATCHAQNAHPNPVPPAEGACAKCHREVEERGECGLCHPPASLPHFYLMGAPREGAARCDVCHPKGSFISTTATQPLVRVGAFDGTERRECASCHPVTTCERCHGTPHPSNWVSIHGLGVGGGGTVNCFACHTDNWCADRCHTVTPGMPFVPKPLPTGGGP